MIEYYLDSENITNVFSSICKKHNSTLDRLVPPLLDHIWVKNLNSNLRLLTGLRLPAVCKDRQLRERRNSLFIRLQFTPRVTSAVRKKLKLV